MVGVFYCCIKSNRLALDRAINLSLKKGNQYMFISMNELKGKKIVIKVLEKRTGRAEYVSDLYWFEENEIHSLENFECEHCRYQLLSIYIVPVKSKYKVKELENGIMLNYTNEEQREKDIEMSFNVIESKDKN